MTAYYNEIDPKKAAWLRQLIKKGLIAHGEVDDRSIEDIRPSELTGYTQCHFFAGVGIWSYALRLAGWPDDRPVWTGSCPCQPFSAAGKAKGFADERHLWPAFHWHISQCRPVTVFGEQVASPDGLAWFDLVQADMEGTGYTCGGVDTCAAGFGAPHIRQRLYWVADDKRCGWGEKQSYIERCNKGDEERKVVGCIGSSTAMRLADVECRRLQDGQLDDKGAERCRGSRGADTHNGTASVQHGDSGRIYNPECAGLEGYSGNVGHKKGWQVETGSGSETCTLNRYPIPSPVNGHWRYADWLFCRDGKWRPVESGTFPLAHGAPERMVRLRGYGDGIVAQQAAAFIMAYREMM